VASHRVIICTQFFVWVLLKFILMLFGCEYVLDLVRLEKWLLCVRPIFFLIWQKRLSFFLFREVIMSQVSLKISLQWDLIASGYLFYSKISKITPNRLFYNRMKPVKVRTKELYYFLLMVKTKKYYFPSNIKNFSES
jgi:hypothetical protein